MDKQRKLINERPQNFIAVAMTINDAQELRSAHSLLHQWEQEIRSASPIVEIGEHRWTLPWVVAAHEAVVRRLKQLNPKENHNSPISASLGPAESLVVQFGAARVRDDGTRVIELDPEIFTKKALENLSLGVGRRVLASAPLSSSDYHLVLIPASVYDALSVDRVDEATRAFKAALGDKFVHKPLRGRVIAGLGAVRSLAARATNGLEAVEHAQRMAAYVLSDDPMTGIRLEAAKKYRAEMVAEAVRMVTRLLQPVDDMRILTEAEQAVTAAVDAVEGDAKSKAEALDVARRIANVVAKELKT